MATMSLGQKSSRVLRLLQGLADRRVASIMAEAGFTQADADEGWQLLRDASTARFGRVAIEPTPRVVAEVDAWENHWYPIIDATLLRRAPDIHEQVFLNLSQASGAAVLVSVRILLDRLDALGKAKDEASKAARAILDTRGVTKAVLDEVRGYLVDAATVDLSAGPEDVEDLAEKQQLAEEAMWAWYREWAQIARSLVRDGRLLIALGLTSTGRPKKDGEVDEIDEPAPAPAPSAPAAPQPGAAPMNGGGSAVA